MREFLEKYKNYIGGSTITIILLCVIYSAINRGSESIDAQVNQTTVNQSTVKSGTDKNISYDEFTVYMKTLKSELRNLTKSMMEFNANQIKNNSEHKSFRDKLFTKDIIKKNIIIDSVSLQPITNTSNYTVTFGQDNYSEIYKNVIGFRLVKAVVPHTVHTVNGNNNRVDYMLDDNPYHFELTPGTYTFTELGHHFVEMLNDHSSQTFHVTNDTIAYKYTLSWSFPEDFYFLWKTSSDNNSIAYRLFGAKNEDDISDLSSPYQFPYIVDQTKHYVDLVIPEIPSIACKMGSKKQIIDRIPLNAEAGSLVYYETPSNELQTTNYFFPMKLSSLTIQLYNDSDKLYNSDNGNNYFEFEITYVENTKLFE